MWLPKDERRLLAGYYKLIGEVQKVKRFDVRDLGKLLRWRSDPSSIPEYGRSAKNLENQDWSDDPDERKKQVSALIDRRCRVKNSNTCLASRGLIELTGHENDSNVMLISLTIAGYDLGRRYAKWFNRSALCFREYRKHWIWLVLSFFGGMLVVEVLRSIRAMWER